jgi:hypothetical protein
MTRFGYLVRGDRMKRPGAAKAILMEAKLFDFDTIACAGQRPDPQPRVRGGRAPALRPGSVRRAPAWRLRGIPGAP